MMPPLDPERTALGMNEATFDYLARAWPRHERMFRVTSPIGETQLVLVHPDEVRHVLHAHARRYHKGKSFRNMKLLMGDGLIVQDGERWRTQRRLIQPLFHDRALGRAAAAMGASAAALAASWSARAGSIVDVTAEISHASLHTLLEVLFSEDLPGMAGADGKNPFDLLTDESERSYQLVPRFRGVLQHVFAVMERRAREGRSPPDFLSLLMQTPMPPEQIVDEVATLIVAGHETSAALLAWVWHLLAFHPEIERALHAELDAGGAELPIADSIVLEALRLYPPVWIMDRAAVADDVVGGAAVTAGTELVVPIYFVQRDPRFVADPDAFRPERFRQEPPPGLLAFGLGPRRCIGEQFALRNARIHIATIARRLRLAAAPGVGLEVPLSPRVNLRPRHPIRMVAQPRST